MSSRKNRNQQNQNPNGSNRNLDGRRLRTVDAAKKLAEYLATKPEIEAKELEERKKRWRDQFEHAETKQEQIMSGKMGAGQGRLDAEYVESKEQAEEKTREAVLKAIRDGMLDPESTGSESSMDVDENDSADEAEKQSSGSSVDAGAGKAQTAGPTYYGWDDEDEFSGEEDDEGAAPREQPARCEGQGKEKAV